MVCALRCECLLIKDFWLGWRIYPSYWTNHSIRFMLVCYVSLVWILPATTHITILDRSHITHHDGVHHLVVFCLGRRGGDFVLRLQPAMGSWFKRILLQDKWAVLWHGWPRSWPFMVSRVYRTDTDVMVLEGVALGRWLDRVHLTWTKDIAFNVSYI